MSLPKEPRQQMINMMYLVLTAMLALNITREVLTAFQTINSSIESSNSSIADKNNLFYEQFDKAQENKADADRVRPLNDAAKEVKAKSEETIKYLDGFKQQVVTMAGGYITNEHGIKEPKEMENIDAATKLFVEEKKGDEIRKRIQDYYDFILSKVNNPDERAAMKKQLEKNFGTVVKSEENPNGDWAYGTFHNIPVVAAVAMMSKYQNDIKTSEGMVVENLFKQIHIDQRVFDDLMAVAVPNNSYALAGDEIEAKIAVVAYNKNLNPSISSNVGAVQVQDGIGTLKFKASGQGVKTINGTINIITQKGSESYPYKFDIMVGNAGASLQIDKMNVMYIGIPNPITMSASGYNIEDVRPVFPAGATLTKKTNGQYDVSVTSEGNLEYSIMAKKAGGSESKIGSGTIRVKSIPTPTAYYGGKWGSSALPTNEAQAQIGIVAKNNDFVYGDGAAQFRVTEYRFAIKRRNGQYQEAPMPIKSYKMEGEARDLLMSCKPGDKIFFDDIKAQGPDGKVRPLSPISLLLR